MQHDLVIARAFRGQPLKLAVISEGHRVIYIAAPERLPAIGTGESEPIGFPKEDVFRFNSMVYDDLRAQWDANGQTDPEAWRGLCRYTS